LLSLDDGIWTIIQQIVEHAPSHELSQHLHPRNITDVPIEEVRQVEEKFRDIAPSLMTRLIVPVERDELLRLYLVLQHNGFQSGLYRHLCMINHSCVPNCIKFEPRAGSRGASEVWATRNIAAGEELLISYVSPLETSFPSAQEYLQSQHGFRCLCQRCSECSEAYERSIVDNSSSLAEADDAVDKSLSKVVNDFEGNFEGIEQMLQVAMNTYRRPPDVEVIDESLETLDEIWERVLEMSELLPPQEILRLQLRMQSIQCSLLSSAIELFDGQKKHAEVAHDYGSKLAATAAKWSVNQQSLFGNNHPDIATSLTDVSNALDFLFRLSSTFSELESDRIVNDIQDVLSAGSWMRLDTDKVEDRAGLHGKKSILKTIGRETSRVKDLYMLAKRVPAAVKVLKGPGVVFWGKTSYH
jgi:hypothetical protein